MPLQIYNNDTWAVENEGADEWLDFWDVVSVLSVQELFPWKEEDECEEIELLIKDRNKIIHQANELKKLMPNRQHQTELDCKWAIAKIEKKIKNLLGTHVNLL